MPPLLLDIPITIRCNIFMVIMGIIILYIKGGSSLEQTPPHPRLVIQAVQQAVSELHRRPLTLAAFLPLCCNTISISSSRAMPALEVLLRLGLALDFC